MDTENNWNEMVSQASQSLIQLVQEKVYAKQKKDTVLKALKTEILEARKAKISFDQILKVLNRQKIAMTKLELVQFCHQELGLLKKRSSKNQKENSPLKKMNGSSKRVPLKKEKQASFPFRVAPDENL